MSSSLLRFVNEENGNGRGKLFWGRVGIDGAPYRGNEVPIGTEEELEERLVRTMDVHNQIFDLSDPESNAKYLAVMTEITNGRSSLLHRQHLKSRVRRKDRQTGEVVVETRIRVYIEWVKPYMEDGSATG